MELVGHRNSQGFCKILLVPSHVVHLLFKYDSWFEITPVGTYCDNDGGIFSTSVTLLMLRVFSSLPITLSFREEDVGKPLSSIP
jgi:hypothetical protein